MTKKISYSEKLRDSRWQKKRLEIFNRDGFKCRSCQSEDETLCVHHLKYDGNPWDVSNDDLVTLCETCHEIIEYGKKNGFDIEINGCTTIFTSSSTREFVFISRKTGIYIVETLDQFYIKTSFLPRHFDEIIGLYQI